MNVLLGLVYITHHESKNPNRQLLNDQAREHLRKSLENAAGTALTPPPLGLGGLQITTERGQAASVADEVVKAAAKFAGSATKGVPDEGRIQVLVEVPGKSAADFKSALSSVHGVENVSGTIATAGGDEKVSIIVQLADTK
jgi:hypothetical protein